MLLKVDQMYSLFKKIPLEMAVGQETKVEGHDQNYQWFLYLTFHLFATQEGSLNIVFRTPTFKAGTFISDAVVQCLSLLHSSAK